MLNLSVDTADPRPNHLPEGLSFNDQESIVEMVVEQILGYENSIAEYDDNDSEDYSKKKDVKINLLFFQITHNEPVTPQYVEKEKRYPDHKAVLSNGIQEIDSPPPQA